MNSMKGTIQGWRENDDSHGWPESWKSMKLNFKKVESRNLVTYMMIVPKSFTWRKSFRYATLAVIWDCGRNSRKKKEIKIYLQIITFYSISTFLNNFQAKTLQISATWLIQSRYADTLVNSEGCVSKFVVRQAETDVTPSRTSCPRWRTMKGPPTSWAQTSFRRRVSSPQNWMAAWWLGWRVAHWPAVVTRRKAASKISVKN